MRLSADIGETVHLAQLDSGQVLYVDKRNAREPIEMFSQAGKVGPAYCTGVGKAMLACVEPEALERGAVAAILSPVHRPHADQPAGCRGGTGRIRARGHAFDREEHEPGIICIAVPILTPQGRMLGALSVTTSTTRNDLAGLAKLAPQLRATADDIAREARNWRFPDQTRQDLDREERTMSGVTLNNVIKRYGEVQVIHGVDLTIEDGEFCVFVGPSGCGKSTLLRMVAGLEETTGRPDPDRRRAT